MAGVSLVVALAVAGLRPGVVLEHRVLLGSLAVIAVVTTVIRRGGRIVRLLLGAGYLAAFGVVVVLRGIPLERPVLLTWLLGLAAVGSVGGRRGGMWPAMQDWLPYGLAMTAYDYTRGAADGLGMPIQEQLPIAIDKVLFAGHVPNVVMQEWLGPFSKTEPAWWQVPMALMYATHFVVPFVIPAVLWMRHRDRFREWRRRFFSVVGLGLVTYVLLPAVPPWMASENGSIGKIERIVNYGWRRIGVDVADRVFNLGSRTFNVVAALPSLHAAFAFVATAYFWRRSRAWVKPVLVLYPLGMALTLIVGGEHYVIDILLGWFYVAIVEVFWTRRERRRIALGGARDERLDPTGRPDDEPGPDPATAGWTADQPGSYGARSR